MNKAILIVLLGLTTGCISGQSKPTAVSTLAYTSRPAGIFTPTATLDLSHAGILLGTPAPQVEQVDFQFDDGVTSLERDIVVRSIDVAYANISTYVDGVAIPATIHVMRDCANLEAAFQEYLKTNNEASGIDSSPCARPFAQEKAVFILLSDPTTPPQADNLSSFVYHEYFHIIQNYLGRGNRTINGRLAPPWMLEGSADYFKLLILQRTGSLLSTESWEWRDTYLRTHDRTLAQLGNDYNAGEAYSLGSLAVRCLVNQFGFEKLILVFKTIGDGSDWEQAFRKVYGMPPEKFSLEFESFRATSFPYSTVTPTLLGNTGRLIGRLVTERGAPLPDVLVITCEVDPKVPCPRTYTDSTGSFSFDVPGGRWAIGFMFNGQNWNGFYYEGASNGFTAIQMKGTWVPVKVGETVAGLTITVPVSAFQFDDPKFPCGFNPPPKSTGKFDIRGTLLRTSGQVVSGYTITACPSSGGTCRGSAVVNGTFNIEVSNGMYGLGVNRANAPENTPPLGWYSPTGLTKNYSCEGAILVNGSNVENIQIVIP